jgi:hypothetical protein
MALPKIDAPVYEIDLPLSKKHIRFRPFLVKEQRNLMMALESDDKQTIERNIRQVLHNCTLTENVDIDSLPIIDVEFYFLNLRARSVGEIVESNYRCENMVQLENRTDPTPCGNSMKTKINLLEIGVEMGATKEVINLTDTISIKLKYPEFSVLESVAKINNATDMAFDMIISSIEYIYDGQQYYYAKESTKKELNDFLESLNQDQFAKIEEFFENLPKLNKKIEMKCSKCGYDHSIEVEGLDSFFD